MGKRQAINNFYGVTVGYIETAANGDITAYDFYMTKLGTYSKKYNRTMDFHGRIIGEGDLTSSLVWEAWNKRKAQQREGLKMAREAKTKKKK
jgi:hypothetical protein